MPTLVQHDRDRNELHVVLQQDRLVSEREWFAPNASVELAPDGSVVEITIHGYYTKPKWPLTEDLVEKYALNEHLDDLKLVYQAFFKSRYKAKVIKMEGPDGNEIVLPAS